MVTTKLSSKGQVIMSRELFQSTVLFNVAGFLKNSVQPKTDEEIEQALQNDIRSKWHAKR